MVLRLLDLWKVNGLLVSHVWAEANVTKTPTIFHGEDGAASSSLRVKQLLNMQALTSSQATDGMVSVRTGLPASLQIDTSMAKLSSLTFHAAKRESMIIGGGSSNRASYPGKDTGIILQSECEREPACRNDSSVASLTSRIHGPVCGQPLTEIQRQWCPKMESITHSL